MVNVNVNDIVLLSTGLVGVVTGFEDYSGKELSETTIRPEHNEYRVLVETQHYTSYEFRKDILEVLS